MSFSSWRKISTLTIASLLSLGFSEYAYGNDNQSHSILSEVEANSIDFLSTSDNTLSQVTSVSQLSDVSPTDWAYEALRSLVERYGCIAGYPDRTFRGNRALSRYSLCRHKCVECRYHI